MKYLLLIMTITSCAIKGMDSKEYMDELEFIEKNTMDSLEFKNKFLRKLPIFQGKEELEINSTMDLILKNNAQRYGAITEAIYSNKKKGINDIDSKELKIVSDKILYALLEATVENQKKADRNREEDLEQAAKDRCCSRFFSITGIIIGVPAITLSIINIIKAFH